MQVVGTTVVDAALDAVAARSLRPAVSEWAARVLRRHVRREPSLMSQVKDGKRLAAALDADKVPKAGRDRVASAFKAGEPVYTPSKPAMEAFLVRAADTMDWIESLPVNDRRIRRIERMAWSDAEKLAEAWHASLAKARKASSGIMEGVRKLADLSDGAFAGELNTAAALRAEGSAMGHCVGGYWNRVSAGDTRIVSIRDKDGHPHVTIELASAPVLAFEDGTSLVASHKPRKGVETVREALHPWVAVQVRGKQNKPPVERYMARVTQWLSQTGIPWFEYGQTRFGGHGEATAVYTSYGSHFRAAEAACDHGEPLLKASLAKGKDFRNAYVESGLAEIHRHASRERVVPFLEAAVPAVMADFAGHLSKGLAVSKAVAASGFALLLDNLTDGSLAETVRDRLFEATSKADKAALCETEKVLADVPGGKDLRLVVHSVPLGPMVLLAAGYGHGLEDRIAEAATPHLRTVAASVLADPAAVHVIRASSAGLGADDIAKAFLFCGLAAELAVMSSKVSQQVAALVSEARPLLRKARGGAIDVERLNRATNLLADGFERRIAARVSEVVPGQFLLLSTQERKPSAAAASRPQANHVIKRYSMP